MCPTCSAPTPHGDRFCLRCGFDFIAAGLLTPAEREQYVQIKNPPWGPRREAGEVPGSTGTGHGDGNVAGNGGVGLASQDTTALRIARTEGLDRPPERSPFGPPASRSPLGDVPPRQRPAARPQLVAEVRSGLRRVVAEVEALTARLDALELTEPAERPVAAGAAVEVSLEPAEPSIVSETPVEPSPSPAPAAPAGGSFAEVGREAARAAQRALLLASLERNGWRMSDVAHELRMGDRTAVRRAIDSLGLVEEFDAARARGLARPGRPQGGAGAV